MLVSFDTLKNNKVFRLLIETWMTMAISEEKYSMQPEPSSPSSGRSRSAVSGLRDGAFETISLSSHKIGDDAAEAIIEAGVYAVGMLRRNRSHKDLCKDFTKMFQSGQPEYLEAVVKAKQKTEWPELDVGNGNTSDHSDSSKSCIDELASVAATAVAKKANEFKVTNNQVDALNKYCFIPLGQFN
jgi:hypothetical protein